MSTPWSTDARQGVHTLRSPGAPAQRPVLTAAPRFVIRPTLAGTSSLPPPELVPIALNRTADIGLGGLVPCLFGTAADEQEDAQQAAEPIPPAHRSDLLQHVPEFVRRPPGKSPRWDGERRAGGGSEVRQRLAIIPDGQLGDHGDGRIGDLRQGAADRRATRSRDCLLHPAQRHRPARRQDAQSEHAGLSARVALPPGARCLARPSHAFGSIGAWNGKITAILGATRSPDRQSRARNQLGTGRITWQDVMAGYCPVRPLRVEQLGYRSQIVSWEMP